MFSHQDKAQQAKQTGSAVITNLQEKVSDLESRLQQSSGHSNEDVTRLTQRLRAYEQELHESTVHARSLEQQLNSSRQEVRSWKYIVLLADINSVTLVF